MDVSVGFMGETFPDFGAVTALQRCSLQRVGNPGYAVHKAVSIRRSGQVGSFFESGQGQLDKMEISQAVKENLRSWVVAG